MSQGDLKEEVNSAENVEKKEVEKKEVIKIETMPEKGKRKNK